MAKTGDNITLSFTSSEAIQTPSVSISGHDVTVTGDNRTWSAVYTMVSTNSEEPVSLNIELQRSRRQSRQRCYQHHRRVCRSVR